MNSLNKLIVHSSDISKLKKLYSVNKYGFLFFTNNIVKRDLDILKDLVLALNSSLFVFNSRLLKNIYRFFKKPYRIVLNNFFLITVSDYNSFYNFPFTLIRGSATERIFFMYFKVRSNFLNFNFFEENFANLLTKLNPSTDISFSKKNQVSLIFNTFLQKFNNNKKLLLILKKIFFIKFS